MLQCPRILREAYPSSPHIMETAIKTYYLNVINDDSGTSEEICNNPVEDDGEDTYPKNKIEILSHELTEEGNEKGIDRIVRLSAKNEIKDAIWEVRKQYEETIEIEVETQYGKIRMKLTKM